MKKLVMLIGIFSLAHLVYADHMNLSPSTKCAFAQKRLEMTQAHLRKAMEELTRLEENRNTHEYEQKSPHSRPARISELKKEIAELEKSIPVMEKSLHALCKAIQ